MSSVRPNQARRHAPRKEEPPTLTSVSASGAGGDTCLGQGQWIVTVSWTTVNPNDAAYKLTVERATDSAGTDFQAWLTDETTASSSAADNTATEGNTGGTNDPVTHYRKYRVRIVRRSDSAIMQTMLTGQETLVLYSDACE